MTDIHRIEHTIREYPLLPFSELLGGSSRLQLVEAREGVPYPFPPSLEVRSRLPQLCPLFLPQAVLPVCFLEVHGLAVPEDMIL